MWLQAIRLLAIERHRERAGLSRLDRRIDGSVPGCRLWASVCIDDLRSFRLIA